MSIYIYFKLVNFIVFVKKDKKEALKKYLLIKKGKETLDLVNSYTMDTMPYSKENNETIVTSKIGDLNKPFYENISRRVVIKMLAGVDDLIQNFACCAAMVLETLVP